MTFGSLFAGIGGMDLGLERAGMRCVWQVEINPYCRRVLAKHWPEVRRHEDVRTFPPDPAEWRCDLIAGGFPCQDISYAGKGAGLAGERSGLWYEFARVVRVVRPRFVLVENVSALLARGLDAVLGTLASLGYDAEWACIPASAVGAPHIRDRAFILAYAIGQGREALGARAVRPRDNTESVLHGTPTLPDADGERSQGLILIGPEARATLGSHRAECEYQWSRDPANDPESGVGRVAHGVPDRVDRLKGLGNAVVPQIAEWIGRRIMSANDQREIAS